MAASPAGLPLAVQMSQFSRFFSTPQGGKILQCERAALNQRLPAIAAYNLLQLSAIRGVDLCDATAAGQMIKMGFAPSVSEARFSDDSLLANYQSFPVANDCVDIVVLHHVLEFAHDPHEMLREASRTLTDGGHMLVIGFNPFSAWPACRQLWQWREGVIARQRTIAAYRLADWFSLLNFDVLSSQSFMLLPPLRKRSARPAQSGPVVQRGLPLPVGLFYMIEAKKRSLPVNPLRRYWRPEMVAGKAARPGIAVSNTHGFSSGEARLRSVS